MLKIVSNDKSESEKEIQKIENQYKDEMNIFIRSLMR